MRGQCRLIALSVLALAVGVTGCDSGPRPGKTQGLQGQPTGPETAATTTAATTESVPPAATVEPKAEAEPKGGAELKTVHFDLDRAKIRPADGQILKEHARWLKSHRDVRVMIGGHADERGSDEYNVKLGARRAYAVKSYLVAQGIEATRLIMTSHGERTPACSDHNESCWSMNRRAEFQIKSR
jgi:peptidoglycan-associated lipoprotein